MKLSRWIGAGALLAGAGGPGRAAGLGGACAPRGGAWAEADRLAGLAGNTLALAAGACLVAVPAGTLAGAWRSNGPRVPGRGVLRWLVLVGLFVPLPVYAVAWQVVLGAWLPPLSLEPGQVAWRPWGQGLLPAAWVHGMAGLPWVVWIVSAGLRTADRGLEEDALLTGGPATVFRRVLLPRAALAAVAAAGWVAVQAATEIPVTDAMMVRTFAEEVYTQFVAASGGLAGAVAVTLPAWVAAVLVGGWVARSAARTFDAPAVGGGPAAEPEARAADAVADGGRRVAGGGAVRRAAAGGARVEGGRRRHAGRVGAGRARGGAAQGGCGPTARCCSAACRRRSGRGWSRPGWRGWRAGWRAGRGGSAGSCSCCAWCWPSPRGRWSGWA